MEFSVVVGPDVFEQARMAARQTVLVSTSEGLHAPPDGATLGRIEEAWGEIESALHKGFLWGKEKARAALDQALQKINTIVQGAGKKAQAVLEALQEKLRIFNQKFVQSALERFPNSVKLGGTDYQLNTLSFTHKIVLSGSIALSVEKVFELVTEGEISIEANYMYPKP